MVHIYITVVKLKLPDIIAFTRHRSFGVRCFLTNRKKTEHGRPLPAAIPTTMAKRRTPSLKRRTTPSSSSSSSSPSYACSEQESSSCEEDANIQKYQHPKHSKKVEFHPPPISTVQSKEAASPRPRRRPRQQANRTRKSRYHPAAAAVRILMVVVQSYH